MNVRVDPGEILLSHQIPLTVRSPRQAAPRSNVPESICAGHYYFSKDSSPPDISDFSQAVRDGGTAARREPNFYFYRKAD